MEKKHSNQAPCLLTEGSSQGRDAGRQERLPFLVTLLKGIHLNAFSMNFVIF